MKLVPYRTFNMLHLTLGIRCHSGCSCGKSKIIDTEKRCTRYNTRDSWKIGGSSEGSGSVHGEHIMSRVICLLLAFRFCCFSHFSWQVTANMRGSSAEEVAERILGQTSLSGLQVRFQNKRNIQTSSLYLIKLSSFLKADLFHSQESGAV